MTLMIVASPCAVVLATMPPLLAAIANAGRHGVLAKSAIVMEKLGSTTTLAFDKTGTLTEGKPRVATVEPASGRSETEVLAVAASLERDSEHPLAPAILAEARSRGIALRDIGDFRVEPGKGIRATIGSVPAALGSGRYLTELGMAPDLLERRAEALRQSGQTVVFVAEGDRVIGMLGIADAVKAGTAEAIDGLRREGVRIVLATGDNRVTGEAVARSLGIAEVTAEILPGEKADLVQRLQAEGRVVAMAGDGINDAPALAQADVGIAMGTGTDVAMESAGVTLVRGDLRAIARARRLSRRTMTNIRQNLWFAFGYNTLGVPIAAGVLYPFFGLLLSPVIAAAAMSLSSVSVIGNSLRLRDRD